jgi:hypothetical protein
MLSCGVMSNCGHKVRHSHTDQENAIYAIAKVLKYDNPSCDNGEGDACAKCI